MKRVASSTILLLLITGSVFAQTAPDAAELTKLLNDFLAGASRNDPAVHERFWADDLIYTRSAGRRVNKAEVLRDVRNAPAPKPTGSENGLHRRGHSHSAVRRHSSGSFSFSCND